MWWKLDCYFIYHFCRFWEAVCFLVERKTWFFNLFRFLMLLFHEIHQFFFWLFEYLIKFIELGLEFGLKLIFIKWSFRSYSKRFIFNVSWWEHVWFHLLYFLDLYQFFLWLFKFLIRWRNIFLGFSLKVIFRIWMFRVEIKNFVFSVVWWKHVWLHFFFLEIYQFFFLFFKALIRWRKLGLELGLKVIFRRCVFRS